MHSTFIRLGERTLEIFYELIGGKIKLRKAINTMDGNDLLPLFSKQDMNKIKEKIQKQNNNLFMIPKKIYEVVSVDILPENVGHFFAMKKMQSIVFPVVEFYNGTKFESMHTAEWLKPTEAYTFTKDELISLLDEAHDTGYWNFNKEGESCDSSFFNFLIFKGLK